MIIKEFSQFLNNIKNKEYKIFDAKIDDCSIFGNICVENNNSRIIIIYGDNACGKSFFSKVLEVILRKQQIAVRSASMSNRTASGMEKIIIFGDEHDQSTGETSISVACKALNSTLSQNNSVAILDEPDVGLANRYQHALGQHIANIVNQFETQGLILISHNATLINSVITHYNNPISFVGIDTQYNYSDWVQNQTPATVQELLLLKEIAHQKYLAINKALG